MNVTKYKAEDLICSNGNSLTVFVDINDNLLKVKDVRGNVNKITSDKLDLGWARYDDTQYTSISKLNLVDQVTVNLPNNGGRTFRSKENVNYYDPTTNKLIADNLNDTYVLTVTFRASAANANSTHLEFSLVGGDYERINQSLAFFKGNEVTDNFHNLYQYYVDADFLANGAGIKIKASGGTAKIWDVIFFIQKTQTYAI